jgi:outer membrane protein TolC
VQEAVLRVQAADKRVAAALAERYPRIDLTASLRTSAERPADLFATWLASLAGQLAVPLFDAGRRAAELDRTEAVVAERLAQFEDTALTAIREVEDALARARQQRRRVDSLERQVELARQSIQRLRGRYINGGADFLDVLDALTRVQDLERELIAARRTRLATRIALSRALAGGIDPPAPAGRGFEALDAGTEAAPTDAKPPGPQDEGDRT